MKLSVENLLAEPQQCCNTGTWSGPLLKGVLWFCRGLFEVKILPLLIRLCDMATTELEALHSELTASHQPEANSPPADTLDTHTMDRQHSAQHSSPEPLSPVNLDGLSVMLSTIQAAAQVTHPAWAHEPVVQKVQELMLKCSKEHAAVLNKAVDLGCR